MKVMKMSEKTLVIRYPDELLLSLKETPEEFERQARLLLAVKLYELGKVSTGMAAQLAGMGRVAFMFELGRFGLSPVGVDPDELAQDAGHA
jgi:predicted HTH domain antitoxin